MFEDFDLINDDSGGADINVSPLIDMVFILLIFFVITTNFNRQTGVEVSKPQASSAVIQKNKTLLIGITRQGTVHIHGRQVSLERLPELISRELEKDSQISAVIVADRDASIGKAVEVMDLCILTGIQQVSVAADEP